MNYPKSPKHKKGEERELLFSTFFILQNSKLKDLVTILYAAVARKEARTARLSCYISLKCEEISFEFSN